MSVKVLYYIGSDGFRVGINAAAVEAIKTGKHAGETWVCLSGGWVAVPLTFEEVTQHLGRLVGWGQPGEVEGER